MNFIKKLFYPDKEAFIERKNNVVDFLEKLCRKSPLSEKNLGTWIRAFHINLPAYLLLGVIFTPKWLASICVLISVIILIPFIYLRGCWLSLLEKRICKDDINVIDALIECSGNTINYNDKLLLNQQRYKITLFVCSMYIPTILGIFYYRFM